MLLYWSSLNNLDAALEFYKEKKNETNTNFSIAHIKELFNKKQ